MFKVFKGLEAGFQMVPGGIAGTVFQHGGGAAEAAIDGETRIQETCENKPKDWSSMTKTQRRNWRKNEAKRNQGTE